MENNKPIEPVNEVVTFEEIIKKYTTINSGDIIDSHLIDITNAMQEHTNLHLDKFADYVKDNSVLSDNRINQLLTEYKNKLK